MRFKKILTSLVVAGALVLGSNTKATLVPFEQTIPDSYSYSGEVLNPENSVDGGFNSYSDILGNFSITENYLVPDGVTEARLKSKFELGKYSSINLSYFDDSEWKTIYHKDSWDRFNPGVLEFVLPSEAYQGTNLQVKTDFSIPHFGEDGKLYEGSTVWLPETSTVSLLGLGCLLLRKK